MPHHHDKLQEVYNAAQCSMLNPDFPMTWAIACCSWTEMLKLDRDAEVHLDAIDRDIEQEPKKFIKEHKIFLLGEWLFNGHFVH